MTKQIFKLKEKLTAAQRAASEMVSGARANFQEELNKVFEADKELDKQIMELESSSDFMCDECGEISTWSRFIVDDKYKDYKTELQEYISEHYCFHYNIEYDTLSQNQGECIVINGDTGDVSLSGHGGVQWIIERKDYEKSSELFALIEEWMNKEGYFPSVLLSDYYGNLSLVDTQKYIKKVAK